MHTSTFTARLLVALTPLLAAASASAQSAWHDLGGNTPLGLSADGQVASGDSLGSYFRWTPGGGVVPIGGTPAGGGVGGQAKLSDDGQRICGTYLNPISGLYELSRYDVGSATWTPFGGIGGLSSGETSSGWGISADGNSVVGLGWVLPSGAHAVQWTQGGSLVDLGSTVPGRSSRANGTDADGDVVVGWQDDIGGFRQGAVWVNGVQSLITAAGTGSKSGEAQECSADGSFAVGIGVSSNGWQPYRWSAGTGAVSLGLLPGVASPRGGATAISADGQTVIGYVRPFAQPATFGQGFLWREDLGMVQLTSYLTSLGVPIPAGVELALPLEISADGTAIAGLARTGTFAFGFVVTGIPATSDSYCTAQVNSLGCLPSITASGVASVSSGLPFVIGATNELAGVNGIMIYSTVGAASLPFNGGTLCVGSPFFRTAFQNSGGSGACSGVFGFDFNAYIATGFDPALIAGAQAWAQYWSRDPGSPTGGTNLTNGLHLYVAP